MSEADAVVGALRNRVLLIGLVGTLLAAAAAWVLARRMVRPVEQLTRASEYVASTQDLGARIPVERDDEVGRLAASFNTMLVALETSREQQKRLVADAGHELRTPLTAVRTNIDLLQRAQNMDPEQRRALLAETQLELRELTDLMSELVDLASDVRREEPVSTVELGPMVASVVERYRRRTGRDITLDVRAEALIDARPGMLERAISNLVDNACKFSPAGSAVDVVVDGVCIEVLDRGLGVAREERERVFDRFYRADAARTMSGSGLGLAIVKQIVELHHGEVTLDARPGGGTVADAAGRRGEALNAHAMSAGVTRLCARAQPHTRGWASVPRRSPSTSSR